jgi:DNA-binding beta-propeller fold protein YncE
MRRANESSARESLLGLGLACATLLGACSQTPIFATPRSFDRPGRASLVCFEMGTTPPTAVPLSRCAPADPATGTLPSGFDLHAIVLQSRRGEIAVVDLRTNAILDTNATIPGFTFIEAGALPVDVVSTQGAVSDRPIATYVANAGSEDVWVYPSSRFRAPASTMDVDAQRVSLGAAPSALLVSPDERFLFVALPALGAVRQYPILDDGLLDEANARDVTLAADAPEPAPAAPEAALYRRECTRVELDVPTTAPTRAARSEGDAPYPVALALDPLTGELLVADAALPIVHRVSLADAAGLGEERTPFATGTPLRDLALTPFVPGTVTQTTAGDRRYLYALDDAGTVVVLDVSDPADPAYGRPLAVEIPATRSEDRIAFDSPATALTVVTTRDYDPALPSPFCVEGGATPGPNGPARLHGVFLAVTLTDGSVRFVDVYDRDAACRGSVGACAGTGNSPASDAVVYVRRHRPRIGAPVTSEIAVLQAPTFTLRGVSFSVDETGRAMSESVPGLGALDCSAPSFAQAFPPADRSADALVCALGDPWAGVRETWTATYEGAVLSGVAGRFEGDAFRAGTTDFCRAGVLGTAAADGLPVPGAAGDQLVVTGELPPESKGDPDCEALVAKDPATGARAVLAFEILDADDAGALTIAPRSIGSDIPREQVAGCFSELVTFEVRTRASWVVRGALSGLVRATSSEGGRCRVPAALPENAGRSFRAYSGVPYVGRTIAFRIVEDPAVPASAGLTLGFGVTGVPQKLGIDLTPGSTSGSIPVDVFYSPFENRLYAVDAGRAALARIAVENVVTERVFQ